MQVLFHIALPSPKCQKHASERHIFFPSVAQKLDSSPRVTMEKGELHNEKQLNFSRKFFKQENALL